MIRKSNVRSKTMNQIDQIVNEILYAVSQSLIEEDKHDVFESVVSVLAENDIDLDQYKGIDTVLDSVIDIEESDDLFEEEEEWEEDQDYDEDE